MAAAFLATGVFLMSSMDITSSVVATGSPEINHSSKLLSLEVFDIRAIFDLTS